jgi:purine-binding chemotaxis protein CheW
MTNGPDQQELSISSGEFLTFILGGEEYGVDILSVRGIQGWDGVTRIPDTPDYLLGVINLRGAIVPIIDMRIKFNLKRAEFDSTTVVIVVRAELGGEDHILGLVVDAVSEVYKIDQGTIQSNPEFNSDQANDMVKGLITIEEKMVIILDVDMLIEDWSPENLNQEEAA